MKKTIYTFFALLAITATGCKDDFFDINDNPNAPTEESITPELILPRALHASGLKMATSYDYAAHWMGYWARSGNYGTSAEQESYNITTTFQQDEWGTETSTTGWYDILADVNTMEKKATAGGTGFYAGAAKVLKSIGFMYLVDQYNNVPYSKAFDLVGNILPAYDKGPDIYNDLFVQLDDAQALITAAEIDVTAYNSDILFGFGATQKAYSSTLAEREKLMWRKLINTMRLKLLIHESQVVSAATVSSVVAKINADGSGFLGAGETASVQPGYQAADLQQNPFWDTYKTTALGATDQYNRANNYVLNKFRNNDDIRYQYFFSPAQTPLNGNVYYGYNFGEVIPNSAPKAVNSSDVAGPGLAKSASQPQWFFTSVESMFLQAEAIQRGWISGNAEDAYRAAVRESFAWLGVPNAVATANTYLDQDIALVSWAKAATSADKIRLIVMQKYLALVGINNFEAYVDYRRLGVPTDLPLSLYSGRNNNKIPLRMQYPQNEYNYNPGNVGAEGVINPQTSRIFWDTE